MQDSKRFYRELKREIKRAGNRKRRRFLKNPEADISDFNFGSNQSDILNGFDNQEKKDK
jgi:hypothetical protein